MVADDLVVMLALEETEPDLGVVRGKQWPKGGEIVFPVGIHSTVHVLSQ